KLDRHSVLMHGTGGEVARGLYWEPDDGPATTLNARDLARRADLPEHPEILEALSAWLAELSSRDALTVLDLFYLEQALGCWAAPQSFGNERSALLFSPFNHRSVIATMMALPPSYKRSGQFARDACLLAWPELLELPFNAFPGGTRLR